MRKRNQGTVGVVFGMVLAGCGGTAADGTGAVIGGGPSIADVYAYFPLANGATWTYRISTPTGATADKVTTVEATEPADGASGPVAFRIRNETLDGANINWEQLDGPAVVRYRQQTLDTTGALLVQKSFAPSSIDFDVSEAHLAPGMTWNETYNETQVGGTETGQPKQEFVKWTVEATDDVVSVPAGTFTSIRVRRHHSSSKNPADEVTWYASGIGRVRETGGGPMADQTRELISATLP